MAKTFKWIDGKEHQFHVLRFYSEPSGLPGLVSSVELPMWIPTAALAYAPRR